MKAWNDILIYVVKIKHPPPPSLDSLKVNATEIYRLTLYFEMKNKYRRMEYVREERLFAINCVP